MTPAARDTLHCAAWCLALFLFVMAAIATDQPQPPSMWWPTLEPPPQGPRHLLPTVHREYDRD